MADSEHRELIDVAAALDGADIVADGIVTLKEIEQAMAVRGYPPDSHDGLSS